MARAFLVVRVAGPLAGECLLATSWCLDPEHGGLDGERRAALAALVREHWAFAIGSSSAGGASADAPSSPLWPEQGSAQGVFRARSGELFSEPPVVVWRQGFTTTALALVLDATESVPMAVQALAVLPCLLRAALLQASRQAAAQQSKDTPSSSASASPPASPSHELELESGLCAERVLAERPEVAELVLHFALPGGVMTVWTPQAVTRLQDSILQNQLL